MEAQNRIANDFEMEAKLTEKHFKKLFGKLATYLHQLEGINTLILAAYIKSPIMTILTIT
jgi:hypothetical protein